ncbi:MAG: DUF2079 domain-containing protein [Candidatus Omnitrophica bacterium]|nr:DUF2079 domain-containing protein [Candidatus Omnitrophota bacterium]
MMIWTSRIFGMLALLDAVGILYLIVAGFPPEIAGYEIHLKNLRKPFIVFFVFVALHWMVHPDRKIKIAQWLQRIRIFSEKPYAIWILFMVYGLLFVWQQMTEYLALDINFIPFGFYDYMLYYLFQGKLNYTGELHGFYHANNILILLAPIWYLFRSPMVLVLAHGMIAAAAVLPLYGIVRLKFHDPVLGLVIAFVYLNFRYLQNLLQMNFCVEIFYPLLIFASLWSAMKERWFLYTVCVILGLSVKEDSPIYFSMLGCLLCFLSRKRVAGFLTILFAAVYFLFIFRIFLPATGNDIATGDLQNFGRYGNSFAEVGWNLIRNPVWGLEALFGSPDKWETWFNLLSRLVFLPVLSPAILLVGGSLFLLFFRGDVSFIDLRFQYSAAVIPFVFIAFVFGFSNVLRRIPERWRSQFSWGICLALILINGGHFTTTRFRADDLRTIALAKSIPQGANVVTHGHLLPYIGYRKYNYYFARPWENKNQSLHAAYAKADYYLIDFHVNLYPLNREDLEATVLRLKNDADYETVIENAGTQYLFRKKQMA